MQANDGARARTAWYDPAAAARWFILPDWEQMVRGLLHAVRRADLSRSEKLKCFATVPAVHYWRRFRASGGRAKRRVKGLRRRPNERSNLVKL
jgi:hypothetical protein